jgi:hypothetical protein
VEAVADPRVVQQWTATVALYQLFTKIWVRRDQRRG